MIEAEPGPAERPVVTPVPESFIPAEDRDVVLRSLRRATPLVFRGFATKGDWELQALCPENGDVKQVELQVSGSGQQTFHGFGGLLQRVKLSELPRVASEAKVEDRSLYLVQSPIWSKNVDQSNLEHLVPKVLEIAPFSGAAMNQGRGLLSRRELDFSKRLESVNLWASIGDTHSNLHYDSKHGLLVVLRGTKDVELFPPSATPHLAAYAVHDPLRSHHSKVPHCCLAARLRRSSCSSACLPKLQRARSFQTQLKMGDALLIPEGWWHHVKTTGVSDASAAGQPVAIAMNFWWRQFAREPKSARPYVLRRLLGETWQPNGCRPDAGGFMKKQPYPWVVSAYDEKDMLASRTASHVSARGVRRRHGKAPRPTLRAMLAAAQRSEAPRTSGSALPSLLATAATSEELEEKELLAELLGALDAAQVAALLSSLDAACAGNAAEHFAAGAALRRLWQVVPQRLLVAKWAEHLRHTLDRILRSALSL